MWAPTQHRISPAELGWAWTTSFLQKKVIYRSGSGVLASVEAARDASLDFETCDLNRGRGRGGGNLTQGTGPTTLTKQCGLTGGRGR